MHRRLFVCGFAFAALGSPRNGSAQPVRTKYRIGVVALQPTADMVGPQPSSPTQRALLDRLRELGYVYGEHFLTEVRGSGGDLERFPRLAAELIDAQVDVIVATGAAVSALKQATSKIPIVMSATNDPVREGLIHSLGRPGGNITGLSLQSLDTLGKRLELLKELAPGDAPAAIIWNAPEVWQAAEASAKQRGWRLLSLEVRELSDIEAAFKKAAEARAGAVMVHAYGIVFAHRHSVVDLAAKSGLPVVYDLRPYAELGGLASYGAEINDIWRRAANFVDKILRGAAPADLPVEQPTKFELVINMKTAKQLGLTIPQSIALRADELIE